MCIRDRNRALDDYDGFVGEFAALRAHVQRLPAQFQVDLYGCSGPAQFQVQQYPERETRDTKRLQKVGRCLPGMPSSGTEAAYGATRRMCTVTLPTTCTL
eukprot:307665-Rhodomonas_salina.3